MTTKNKQNVPWQSQLESLVPYHLDKGILPADIHQQVLYFIKQAKTRTFRAHLTYLEGLVFCPPTKWKSLPTYLKIYTLADMQEYALNSYDVISAMVDILAPIPLEKFILARIIPQPSHVMPHAKSTTEVMRDMRKHGILTWIK